MKGQKKTRYMMSIFDVKSIINGTSIHIIHCIIVKVLFTSELISFDSGYRPKRLP